MIIPNKTELTAEEKKQWTRTYLDGIVNTAQSSSLPDSNQYGMCGGTFQQSFTGKQFQKFLIESKFAADSNQALRLAETMMEEGILA